MSAPEAFELLSLPNAVLSSSGFTERGVLYLECVTITVPQGLGTNRDVYLVLRLNSSETPIDPARAIQRTDGAGSRSFTFYATQTDPTELVLTVSVPANGSNPQLSEDLETFEGILAQYADLRGPPQSAGGSNATPKVVSGQDRKDLRGHLVMIDEDTGEVVGEVEDKFRIREEQMMNEKGHENDPVVIEVPDEYTRDSDATTIEVFAKIIPPDQQDWITKSATVVSHAISMTTNLLLTTITTASNYYIKNSPASPHHPNNASGSASKDTSGSTNAPPPVPPRALVFLTSERTRKGLATVHTATGQAVKVSAKTVGLIDSMIRRAMGAKEKRVRTQFTSSSTAAPSAGPSSLYPNAGSGPSYAARTPSPTPSGLAPPPYTANTQDKPGLPPRRSPSPAPPLPPRTVTGMPENMVSPAPQPKLSRKDRVLISADLILSTIDDSTRRILDSGTENLGKVVGHKYGPDAAHSSLLMAGTARNVGLVYIDMRGIGRRALLKRAGKTWVKGRVSGNNKTAQETPYAPYVPKD